MFVTVEVNFFVLRLMFTTKNRTTCQCFEMEIVLSILLMNTELMADVGLCNKNIRTHQHQRFVVGDQRWKNL